MPLDPILNEEIIRQHIPVIDSNISEQHIQTCEPKDWDTCRVEKMGCPGCYYDEVIESDILIADTKPISQLSRTIKNDVCLHCGNGKPNYCEGCFQQLIVENTDLRLAMAHNKDITKQFIKDLLRALSEEGEHNHNRVLATIMNFNAGLDSGGSK